MRRLAVEHVIAVACICQVVCKNAFVSCQGRVLLSNVSNISKVSEVIAMQNFGMSQTAEAQLKNC